jgi:hypothetical protein
VAVVSLHPEGKELREGRDSKELWKSVERSNTPRAEPARGAPGGGRIPCLFIFPGRVSFVRNVLCGPEMSSVRVANP